MLETIRKVLELLSPSERRKGYLLLIMVLIMAMLDTAGVASIMPFMSVLANPDAINESGLLQKVYKGFDFKSTESFLYFLGVVVFIALISSIVFRALTTYLLLRFTFMRNYTLSQRLVAAYLHQPYEWFLNHHSADLGKTILAEVEQVVNGSIIPLMLMIAYATVVLSLMMLLFVIKPVLAISVVSALGMAYAAIYFSLRSYIDRIGHDRVKANRERFQVIQETFGGIKDVKVSGLESTMLGRYKGPAMRYARHLAILQIAVELPRYVLEAIAFGGILLVVMYFISIENGLRSVLPVLAVYTFAGYRLMPALQQVYLQISSMRFSSPALDALHKDLLGFGGGINEEVTRKEKHILPLRHKFKLEDVTYAYPNSEKPTLSELSLTFSAKSTVAIVGTTGSGKTTTVDIILGLLRPQSGKMTVDDKKVTDENIRQWQDAIGYVPQHIYLADDTVTANIAFGVPMNDINHEAVERAARIANLHDFVANDLTLGYKTMVGERGVRLSGGQRQRIGIARALYHDPEVLILDEATSALDNLTEQAVMEAVHNLGHRKTVIIIAHRLSTVRQCDVIFMLENGRLLDSGTFDELLTKNEIFRSMAGKVV